MTRGFGFALLVAIGSTMLSIRDGSVSAAPLTISQTGSVVASFSAWDGTSQTLGFPNDGLASVSINPFNASLGTLEKIIIEWNIGATLNITNGATLSVGLLSGWGGTALVNESPYNGGSVPVTSGVAGANQTLSTSTGNVLIRTEFLPQPPVNYNPSIWNAFIGNSPFQANFPVTSPTYFTGGQYYASGTVSAYRNVEVTYYYTPSAVPEIDPAGLGMALAIVTGALGIVEHRRMKTRRVA
jgi:hypothetical protein